MKYTIEEMIAAIKNVHGWCTPEKAIRLYKLVQETKAEQSVELGVYYGKSLFALAYAHANQNLGNACGIDSWNNEDCKEGSISNANRLWWEQADLEEAFSQFKLFLFKNKLQDNCSFLRGRSDVMHKFFSDDSIDILHMDSNHCKEIITAELELWTPKIKISGFLIADDCQWIEARDAYETIPSYGYQLYEDHTDWKIFVRI